MLIFLKKILGAGHGSEHGEEVDYIHVPKYAFEICVVLSGLIFFNQNLNLIVTNNLIILKQYIFSGYWKQFCITLLELG